MNTTKESLSSLRQKATDFVNSLELPPMPADIARLSDKPILFTDDKEAAYVSAGNIVSFVEGLSATHKQDVLNSTLLAQLAANKAFDREKDTVKWYGKYVEVLENVGWTLSKFSFAKFTTTNSSMEVEKVVIELLTAIASGNELLVAIKAFEALKDLDSGSKGFKLWDSQSHDASNGNFQICPCLESDGDVAMGLGAFYFSTKKVDFGFLWFKYASLDISMYQGAQTVVLNEQIYATVRQAIIQKLGQNAVNYVADLDI